MNNSAVDILFVGDNPNDVELDLHGLKSKIISNHRGLPPLNQKIVIKLQVL